MVSRQGRWTGLDLSLVMVMLGAPGLGGLKGQEAKDGQPAAAARHTQRRLTTGSSAPSSVGYTVGNRERARKWRIIPLDVDHARASARGIVSMGSTSLTGVCRRARASLPPVVLPA